VPRGKGLGGSTLINGGIYVRGQGRDFDGWAQRGATGWGSEAVMPYFRRLECYAGGADDGLGGRGRTGPVKIVEVGMRHPLIDAFMAAAEQAGHRINSDYNGADQDGACRYQVTQHGGRRWSAREAYLQPAFGRPNLRVETDAFVERIEIEAGRAVAAIYRQGGRVLRVRARREIVLAAGAIQSPQLLELSGIGRPDVLNAAGLPIVHALPGVGENYRDHFCTRMNWRVREPITFNEQSRGLGLAKAVVQYALTGGGLLSLATGLVGGFIRTRAELEGPDVQYFFVPASYANAADRVLDRQPGMTIGVTQLRPNSKGSIHIVSPDPARQPAIRPNFLAVADDGEVLTAGMREARRIVSQPAFDRYRGEELNPGDAVESDEAWLDFSRRTGQTIYHPVGTCRMGTDPGAVVDPDLRVRGIAGLGVADASVMPTIVSANTQAAVMMIAERAADLIAARR